MMKWIKNWNAVAVFLVLGAFFLGWNYPSLVHLKPVKKEIITMDSGGIIWEYIDKYATYAADGTRVEVHGMCASACTFFLGLLPENQYCVSDRALLGFHGVYLFNQETHESFFNPEMTPFIMNYVYPEKVRKVLAEKGFDGMSDVDQSLPMKMIWLKNTDLGLPTC